MADHYIDFDEIQFYGPFAVRQLRAIVKGLISEFDAGVELMAATLDQATGSVKAQVESSRGATLEISLHAAEKQPLVHFAHDLLGRFSRHLDGHAPGTIQRKAFFTTDGTAKGVGKRAALVVLALAHISTELG